MSETDDQARATDDRAKATKFVLAFEGWFSALVKPTKDGLEEARLALIDAIMEQP